MLHPMSSEWVGNAGAVKVLCVVMSVMACYRFLALDSLFLAALLATSAQLGSWEHRAPIRCCRGTGD